MKIVKPYGEKMKVTSDPVGKSRTKQSMKDECNINFILAKFQKTGVIEHRKTYEGNYGEFAAIDFHEAMNIVAEAEEMFLTIPAEIRKKFNNDPGEFLKFATNGENIVELRKLGLAQLIENPPAGVNQYGEPIPQEPGEPDDGVVRPDPAGP